MLGCLSPHHDDCDDASLTVAGGCVEHVPLDLNFYVPVTPAMHTTSQTGLWYDRV